MSLVPTRIFARTLTVTLPSLQMRQGDAKTEIQGQLQDIRLRLTPDTFTVQREELVYTQSTVDHVDAAILNKERTIYLRRERVGGLGLSVKGGAEHNLPVLVSRIFKDQAGNIFQTLKQKKRNPRSCDERISVALFQDRMTVYVMKAIDSLLSF